MPPVRLVIFQTAGRAVPFRDWFKGLSPKARAKCRVRLEHLSNEGFGLRRPLADYLRDGVYELCFKHLGVNYRVLYFFSGRKTAVVSHGFVKQETKVPTQEIAFAIQNMTAFTKNPGKHSCPSRNQDHGPQKNLK